MSISSLSGSFTVSSCSVSSDTDISINVFRRRENIVYLPYLNQEDVVVAFVKGEENLASNSIGIDDKSSFLITNRLEVGDEGIVVRNISSYIFETDQLFVTDRLVSQSDGSYKPLFYKHILSTTNVPRSTGYVLASNTVLSEIRILDKDLQEVQIDTDGLDFDEGIVYNNLKNEADIRSGEYSVYFVQYTVKVGSNIFTYTEILNNQEVYTVGSFEDLDEDLNIIQDGRKVYIVSEIGNQFEITLPISGDYGFRIKDASKIQIKPFENIELTYPWFARVSNGRFQTPSVGSVRKYSIEQFGDQAWNPESPYKKITTELSNYIARNLIRLDRDNIYENSDDSLYIDILVNDSNNEGIAAFTTNSSLSETLASNGATYTYWTFTNKIGIRSIDYLNGLIDIEGYTLDPSYLIYSTYYFEEKDFEFDEVDLNPVNNPDILDLTLVLFVVPDLENQSLFYLLVDKKNQVIESDWTSFDNDTQLMTNGHELYYSGVPVFISAGVDYEDFTEDYSVEGNGTYLVVGELTVSPHIDIKDLEIKDIRVPGGGIIESEVPNAKSENSEVIWYWDIGRWDGQSYPGNASYLVEVPVSVLDGAGGTFSQKQVRDIVEKHTAFGFYPVVRAYGVDPFAYDVEPRANSILIYWYSYGSDYYYDVYYSKDKDGPWTKSNLTLLSDVPSGNSYEITGLKTGTEYFIMVIGGIIEDGEFLSQNGQAVGPVEDGAKSVYNFNIAKVKTFAYTSTGTSDFSNSFEVI